MAEEAPEIKVNEVIAQESEEKLIESYEADAIETEDAGGEENLPNAPKHFMSIGLSEDIKKQVQQLHIYSLPIPKINSFYRLTDNLINQEKYEGTTWETSKIRFLKRTTRNIAEQLADEACLEECKRRTNIYEQEGAPDTEEIRNLQSELQEYFDKVNKESEELMAKNLEKSKGCMNEIFDDLERKVKNMQLKRDIEASRQWHMEQWSAIADFKMDDNIRDKASTYSSMQKVHDALREAFTLRENNKKATEDEMVRRGMDYTDQLVYEFKRVVSIATQKTRAEQLAQEKKEIDEAFKDDSKRIEASSAMQEILENITALREKIEGVGAKKSVTRKRSELQAENPPLENNENPPENTEIASEG